MLLAHPKGGARAAEFSPDGRYVAYASDETGRDEVYVQAFPSGTNWIASEGGGGQVRWSPNGHELFYVHDDALVSVPIGTQGTFSIGPPRVLFHNPNFQTSYDEPTYDVSPDGQRFAIIETLQNPVDKICVLSNTKNGLADLRK